MKELKKDFNKEEKFDKSSKPFKFSKNKGKKGESFFKKGKPFNDISYYTKNPSITEAFAKLPFNWIVGNIIPQLNGTIAFPAIVSYMVDWMASNKPNNKMYGGENIAQGPDILDMVASIIYMNERKANAGATNNIEHVDVIISNLLASIDLFVNAHYCNRMFRIAYSYSWKNRMIPDYIFSEHFDVDYQDFIQNLANYRGRYDMLVAKAKTIRTLANFPFINAAMAQFDEIFRDSDTDTGRESLIVSNKPLHHIYDPVGTVTYPGGSVRLMKMSDIYPNIASGLKEKIVYTGVRKPVIGTPSANFKFSFLLDIMDTQINALINDNDFNLIQADIEKAFGDMSGYLEIDKAPTDEVIKPVYSNEFNLMFRNGSFLPAATDTWGYQTFAPTEEEPYQLKCLSQNAIVNSIVQDHDANLGKTKLVWFNHQLQVKINASDNLMLNLIDSESDNPSTEDVIISTRFKREMLRGNSEAPAEWGIPEELRPSFPSNSEIMQAKVSSNFMTWGGVITLLSTNQNLVRRSLVSWDNTTMNLPANLLALENHPIFVNSTGAIFANINNIRAIAISELEPIQRACFLSLWDLPSRTNI